MVKKIIWPETVQKQFQQAFEYISNNSPQNANKVKKAVLDSTRELNRNTERYPPDKYKKDNDGTFRAYELYGFRISYRITENDIIIVRFRHTKMKPQFY